MQAQEIVERDLGCTCANWAANMSHLRDLLGVGITHGPDYQGTPFRYCPWCGQRLVGIRSQRDDTLLEKVRQRIEEAFFGVDKYEMPQAPNLLVASRLISGYRQVSGDVEGAVDLMLSFVEMGTRFIYRYGDMDEPFYEGLELMLADFRDLLFAYPDLYEKAGLAQRLVTLERDAGKLAWGYGDYVLDRVSEIQQYFDDI